MRIPVIHRRLSTPGWTTMIWFRRTLQRWPTKSTNLSSGQSGSTRQHPANSPASSGATSPWCMRPSGESGHILMRELLLSTQAVLRDHQRARAKPKPEDHVATVRVGIIEALLFLDPLAAQRIVAPEVAGVCFHDSPLISCRHIMSVIVTKGMAAFLFFC